METPKGLLVHQPRLLKRMREKFGDKVSNLKKTETPLSAGYVTKNPEEGDELNPNEQTEYQSGVGMNIYLVKQSRPDLGNATRELSKRMQKADPEQRDGLLRLIKFALDTEGAKLVIEPMPLNETKGMWFIKALCDCGFATDESRKSVTGFMVYFCGVLVAWKSKMQKNVTISTTEGDYVSISEVSFEILFVWHIAKDMGINVTLPIIVNVDNAGAIFLSNNKLVGQRTKHIDTRYHFVREYVEDGILKIVYVRSEDNDADILTKNVDSKTYWRHCQKFMRYDEVPQFSE